MTERAHQKGGAGLTGVAVAATLLYGAIVPLTSRIRPADYADGRTADPEDRRVRNSSAAAQMLGEFRTGVSDILYLKTERYLHGGIAFAPHEDEDPQVNEVEGMLDVHGEAEAGHEHDHEHAHEHGPACDHGEASEGDGEHGLTTVIPGREKDFRGWVGDLHRAVKPWVDPKQGHPPMTDGTELLPWFRIMTLSDPHFVRGYAAGGWWIKARNPEAALAFVDEGIRNNPEAFQIYHTRGLILEGEARRLEGKDDSEAARLRREAQAAFRKAAGLAVAQRPAGWEPGKASPRWDADREEDAFAAARLDVMMEQEWGDPKAAAERGRIYRAKLGPDPVLERLAQ